MTDAKIVPIEIVHEIVTHLQTFDLTLFCFSFGVETVKTVFFLNKVMAIWKM
jgi:hypothetical protein